MAKGKPFPPEFRAEAVRLYRMVFQMAGIILKPVSIMSLLKRMLEKQTKETVN